jgi:hypothetical protein
MMQKPFTGKLAPIRARLRAERRGAGAGRADKIGDVEQWSAYAPIQVRASLFRFHAVKVCVNPNVTIPNSKNGV